MWPFPPRLALLLVFLPVGEHRRASTRGHTGSFIVQNGGAASASRGGAGLGVQGRRPWLLTWGIPQVPCVCLPWEVLAALGVVPSATVSRSPFPGRAGIREQDGGRGSRSKETVVVASGGGQPGGPGGRARASGGRTLPWECGWGAWRGSPACMPAALGELKHRRRGNVRLCLRGRSPAPSRLPLQPPGPAHRPSPNTGSRPLLQPHSPVSACTWGACS